MIKTTNGKFEEGDRVSIETKAGYIEGTLRYHNYHGFYVDPDSWMPIVYISDWTKLKKKQ